MQAIPKKIQSPKLQALGFSWACPVRNRSRFATVSSYRGIVTLELLIAFALGVTFLVGATIVSFGSQSPTLDTRLTGKAMPKARDYQQVSVMVARDNWDTFGVMNLSETDDIYTKSRTITDISPCVRFVGSDTDWVSERSRSQFIDFKTLIASVVKAKAFGGGCDPFPPGEWDTPDVLGYTPSPYIEGEATGLDVAHFGNSRFLFLPSVYGSPEKDDFWIVDASDPGAISPPVQQLHTSPGLNAVDVARIDVAGTPKTYAFVANNDVADHLMVIDVSDPLAPVHIHPGASRSLPHTTTAVARSIFYYDKKVYIGTQYLAFGTPPQNREFHIFNVADPTSPVWEASIDVNRNINAIFVRDGVAFLATGPGAVGTKNPLRIYDVDPSSGTYLQQIGFFVAHSSNNTEGTSLFVLGNTLYLGMGRATGSNKDFFILDITNLSSPQEYAPGSSYKIGINTYNSKISSIAVQGPYAFLGTTDPNNPVFIMRIAHPTTATRINTCSASPLPQGLSGMRYVDDMLFVSFRSNEAFRILHDTPSVCTP